MAQIHNSDLFKEVRDGIKAQQLRDIIPNQLADKIVPVMEVNPKLFRRCNITRGVSKTTSGTQTIYTTPSDREFYLVGIMGGLAKDAVCDVATGRIQISAIINGDTQSIMDLPVLTLTAQSLTNSISLSDPIKVDKNTAIVISGTFTAGAMSRTGTIIGYTVENINA